MLLNELFSGKPLFESSATVQLVVNHINDMVPSVRAIWLVRAKPRAPWQFYAVVHDQVDHDALLKAKDDVLRIQRGMQGVDIRIEIVIESAFQKPEGAMKIFAAPVDNGFGQASAEAAPVLAA